MALGLAVCAMAYGDAPWITAPPRTVQSQDQESCWEVVGCADAGEAARERRAWQNARWQAVEAHFKARDIPAEKLRKDTPKIQEAIASHAETVFSSERVIENCVQNGQYYALVRTHIRSAELKKWMFIAGADMEEIYKGWSNPSFLVTLEDDRSRVCVQDCLLKQGFNVTSAVMREEIAQHSAEAYGGQRKAIQQALARKHKSEIIVDGQCRLEPRDPVTYENQTIYAYDATLRVEVIDAATANIIVSKEWSYRAKLDDHTTDFQQQEALRKCQTKLLDLYASSIIHEILLHYFEWKITYNIQFVQTPASARAQIVECLKSIPDLEFLSDEFDNGVMEVKAKCAGDPESIIKKVQTDLHFDLRRKTRGLLVFGGKDNGG
jgi:hypothetical protein